MRHTLPPFCYPSSPSLLQGAGLSPAPAEASFYMKVSFLMPRIPEKRGPGFLAVCLAAPTTLFSIGYVRPTVQEQQLVTHFRSPR